MKSVLISIQPKWCELIASGKKTIEVRKTMPKVEEPFKVYIYCTQGKFKDLGVIGNQMYHKRMKVIGEFVCDEIECFTTDYRADIEQVKRIIKQSCVCFMGLSEYEANSMCLYGWHISNLVIYDKPRELSEFRVVKSQKCPAYLNGLCLDVEQNHVIHCENLDCKCKNLTRPPQSWCYVESEVEQNAR